MLLKLGPVIEKGDFKRITIKYFTKKIINS